MCNRVLAALAMAALCISSAAAAGETYTPTTLTAEQVLAKARAARGSIKPGAYHEAFTETGGNGDVSQVDEYDQGQDYKVTVRDGDFVTAYGSRNGVGWIQDANGTVTIESGYHERDDPYAKSMRAASTGTADDGIKVLGITTTAPACIVLELRPKTGLLQRRYYDANSFFVRRIETTGYDGVTRVDEYDDFQTAYGATFARTTSYQDGHPENAERSHVDAFERVAASGSKLAIPQSRTLFDTQGRPAVTIPADFTPDGIIVRVTIAGRGLDFVLDSGAEDIVLDSGVARQLGLTVSNIRKGNLSGDFTVGQTRVPDFSLGDLTAHNVAIAAIPYSDMIGTRKVVGLLGGDFFANGRISVSFKDHTVQLLSPSGPAPAAPWVSIPIEIDDLTPRAHAKFNGVDGAFTVDLGAFETMLYGHYFNQFRPKSKGDVVGYVVGVAGKDDAYHEYTFSRFDVGSLAFADANAIVPEGKSWEEQDIDGLLGRNILDNFNLIFDYPNQKLYLDSMVQ
jgi:outer membrane lipoprotein-sorting protein